jgi:pyruvate/2-oxoglutarate dehydrogenase complex dihydrolipoamide dehydrogenase (E3) component
MRREDVVVVGGGLSGVVAAFAARKNGASVTLLDEQPQIGGYLRWTLSGQRGMPEELGDKRGFELAQVGWELLYDAGVNVQLRSTVWGLFDDNVLSVVNPDASYQVRADRVILATGSTDVAIPFEGWDLPGVMTARAALIAMNIHRVLPGRRVGIVGSGSDLDELTASLEYAGAEVGLHVADPGSATVGGDGTVAWLSEGSNQVEVDVVITASGVQPDSELALHAQVKARYSQLSGVFVPVRDAHLMTSFEHLYIVGDAAGICTSAEAAAEGMVAGEAATNGKGLQEAIAALVEVRSNERAAEIESLMPSGTTSDEIGK